MHKIHTENVKALQKLSNFEMPELTYASDADAEDSYLGSVSNESLEVLEHFGEEAPALLNAYSSALEDVIRQQQLLIGDLQQLIKQLEEG